jgi:DNA-binding NarL/FixJ family response regulator
VALYRSIADRAEAGGVLTDLHLARRRLRELGARTSPPRRQVGPLGLSRRELEVARLAATGASNPEIAATLFLSRKTVERHVSAALEKAGARNRTELATRLAAIAEPGAAAEMRELPDTGTGT